MTFGPVRSSTETKSSPGLRAISLVKGIFHARVDLSCYPTPALLILVLVSRSWFKLTSSSFFIYKTILLVKSSTLCGTSQRFQYFFITKIWLGCVRASLTWSSKSIRKIVLSSKYFPYISRIENWGNSRKVYTEITRKWFRKCFIMSIRGFMIPFCSRSKLVYCFFGCIGQPYTDKDKYRPTTCRGYTAFAIYYSAF